MSVMDIIVNFIIIITAPKMESVFFFFLNTCVYIDDKLQWIDNRNAILPKNCFNIPVLMM